MSERGTTWGESAGTFVDDDGSTFFAHEEIGRGVLTSVCAGEAEGTGRAVAIKTVLPIWVGHPVAEARIARERELSEAIHASEPHAACAQILCGGRQVLAAGRSRPFHVSPLYEGVTLAERVHEAHERGARIDAGQALAWADQLLSGLQRLHDLGWVHRDVKPQNIHLVASWARDGVPDRGPRAILIDYGLAVRVGSALGDSDESFGTPAYVSPEAVAGAVLDGRADLYSLGLVLFELLCRRRPFAGRDPVSLIEAHLSEPCPSLRELCPALSPELDVVISATLAKHPGDRPGDAASLAALLRATPEGRTAPYTSPTPAT